MEWLLEPTGMSTGTSSKKGESWNGICCMYRRSSVALLAALHVYLSCFLHVYLSCLFQWSSDVRAPAPPLLLGVEL